MTESPQGQPYTVVVGVSPTTKATAALAWGHAQARQNSGRVIACSAPLTTSQ